MKNCLIIDLFPDSPLAGNIVDQTDIEMGFIEANYYPDGELYIRIDSNVKDKTVIVLSRLDHPNEHFLLLIFMLDNLRDLGAKEIVLIAPYLPYMRQDKINRTGEAFTPRYFAELINGKIDRLVTIDPHLHRINKLSELYQTDCIILHASVLISEWINANLTSTVILGIEKESEPWIKLVAKETDSPYYIIDKSIDADGNVTAKVPDIEDKKLLPVFVDDIISTGTTLILGMNELAKRGFKDPVCIGVHGIFDKDIYNKLTKAGAQQIITTNTSPNFTSKIDITELLIDSLVDLDIATLTQHTDEEED